MTLAMNSLGEVLKDDELVELASLSLEEQDTVSLVHALQRVFGTGRWRFYHFHNKTVLSIEFICPEDELKPIKAKFPNAEYWEMADSQWSLDFNITEMHGLDFCKLFIKATEETEALWNTQGVSVI